jgi:hypothetical protein
MRVTVFIRCIIVAGLLPLAACGFSAPAPSRTPAPLAPAPPVSLLTATVAIPAAEIAHALNKKTNSDLATLHDQPVDCMLAKCRLDLQAARTGAIVATAADNAIALSVPLSVTAQMAVKGPFFKTNAEGAAAGTSETRTALALTGDWRVASSTQGKITLSDAQLKVGPLRMRIADLWNRNAQHLSAPLFKALDRHIAASIKIKPQAERLWAKAAYPIRVGKSPEAWLVLAPERIFLAQPTTRDNAVAVSLGVAVRAQIIVADHAPAPLTQPPLPAPEPLQTPSDRFRLVVPVLLPYHEAVTLAMQQLAKKPLRVNGMVVRFDRLNILPSGTDVIVQAHFCVKQNWDPFGWFDSCGDGYLRGAPVFDSHTQTIRIAGLHYDIATENILLSAMHALAGDSLAKALETRLVFDANRDLAKLDDEVKTALAKPQGRGVRIRGEIQSFGAPQLTWTDDGFLASFPAEGKISADLNIERTAN